MGSPIPTRRWARRRGNPSSGPPGSRSAPLPAGPRTASAPPPARNGRQRPAQPPATAATQTPPTPRRARASTPARPGAGRRLATAKEASHAQAAPTQPEPDYRWPNCDEQLPGVSIRPLRHRDLQALLARLNHHHHDQDEGRLAAAAEGRPAVAGRLWAVRVQASVGRPGASAHAEYRRRRAAERANWTQSLPWRASAVLAAAVAAGLLGAQVAPDLAGLLIVVATAGLGWRLRFRPSVDTLAWRRGAAGERRTARLLAPSSAMAGQSCTTWPSPAQPPTSITWSSAPAA